MITTDRRGLSAQVYQDFCYWILDDLAERKTDSGENLERGRRRVQTINGRSRPVYLLGKHICYQGKLPFRGSDFSLRVSIAVRALEKSEGFTNTQACEAITDHPLVRYWLGRSNRRPHRALKTNLSVRARRTETIRQMVFKFVERDRIYFNGQFRMWLNRFRAFFAADADWYSELTEVASKSLLDTEKVYGRVHPLVGMWHCRLATYFHEQRRYERALFHYRRTLVIMKSDPKATQHHEWLLPRLSTLRQNIRACQHGEPRFVGKPRIVC
jgi:hypothetical protein